MAEETSKTTPEQFISVTAGEYLFSGLFVQIRNGKAYRTGDKHTIRGITMSNALPGEQVFIATSGPVNLYGAVPISTVYLPATPRRQGVLAKIAQWISRLWGNK